MAKYNINMLYPFLLQMFLHLNPIKALAKLMVIEADDFIFGQVMSNGDVIISTLKNVCMMGVVDP